MTKCPNDSEAYRSYLEVVTRNRSPQMRSLHWNSGMRKEVCSGPQNFAVAQQVEGLSQLIGYKVHIYRLDTKMK